MAGGIPRTIQQPASLHAFESVDLYAMVSGYLKTQAVDIGSRIKKGDVLAVIDAPREAKAVDEAAALLAQSQGEGRPGEGPFKGGRAQREAAAARGKVAESRSRTAHRPAAVCREIIRKDQGAGRRNRRLKALLAEEQTSDLAAARRPNDGASEILTPGRSSWPPRPPSTRPGRCREAEASGRGRGPRDRARVNLEYAKIVAPLTAS